MKLRIKDVFIKTRLRQSFSPALANYKKIKSLQCVVKTAKVILKFSMVKITAFFISESKLAALQAYRRGMVQCFLFFFSVEKSASTV